MNIKLLVSSISLLSFGLCLDLEFIFAIPAEEASMCWGTQRPGRAWTPGKSLITYIVRVWVLESIKHCPLPLTQAGKAFVCP